jgi:hypothetical protein
MGVGRCSEDWKGMKRLKGQDLYSYWHSCTARKKTPLTPALNEHSNKTFEHVTIES